MLEVVETQELGPWTARWDSLVDRLPRPTPFLRSWWVDHAHAGDAALLLVRDGDELVGGLALEQASDRADLTAVGHDLCPDHVDVLCRPGSEAPVVEALSTHLRRQGSRVVDYGLMSEPSRVMRVLPRPVQRTATAVAPFAALPADADSYFETRASRVRNTIDRARRRLSKAGVHYEVAGAGDVEDAVDALHKLHEARWGDDSQFLRSYDRFAAAARAGAARDEVTFHLLTGDPGPIAVLVTFEVGGIASYYQSGRLTDHEWRGSGTVLIADVIRRSCEQGATELDFLRGDETYKADWATGNRVLTGLRGAHGVSANARLLRSGARRVASRVARRLRWKR
jgi:CelD/BcsL family acetyltransferase involved in cellulose biosynthesis